MTDDRRNKPDKPLTPDVMHGRSFAGASYASTEREQTDDRLRATKPDEDDEVTDAEIEAREPSDDEISP